MGGGGGTEAGQTLGLTIRGKALTSLTQGRILAAQGGSWYPVNLLGAVMPAPKPPRSLQVAVHLSKDGV